MSQQRTLLIEIGTEELPPKSLLQLSQAFSAGVVDGLNEAGLTCESHHSFATPRRIAVRIEGLPESQPDRESERRGPALQAAFDADGKPTKAAEGFARSCGVEVDQLRTLESDKGSWLVYTVAQEGKATATLLQDIVAQALAKLPINKRMRWGGGDAEFVRPVHWVCAVFGSEIVPIDVFGISAGATTVGHRFHANSNIEVDADSYEQALHDVGRVIADFDQRKALIRQQIETSAKAASAQAMIDADLLDEVTALVEWPVAVTGEFDPAFLTLPPEVLITTLQDNQKYFPLYDADGELLSKFITIANIESRNPAAVQDGNERVVRPRLADAMFFWEQDRKHSLESRVEVLDTVLFQKQLGSVAAKSRRVAEVAAWLSAQLSVDGSDARRAAQLGKCDLMTDMVGEFPSLQGVMGEYYARHDN
ncbi:MAG: glycine--tRNA ligase subunit beta, partial [Pseudomonadota bacterium]